MLEELQEPQEPLLTFYASLCTELPWITLFIAVMVLVELQLRYCLPCLRATVKVLEALIVVVLMRVWVDRDFVRQEMWADTLRRFVNASSTAAGGS